MNIFKTAAIAAALLFAVPALAGRVAPDDEGATFEDGKGDKASKRSQRRLARMTEKLDLSEAQAAEIAAIQADYEPGGSREEAKALRAEIKALWAERPVDVGAIQAAAAELDELQDARRNERIEMKAEVVAVLTPEQQARFVETMGDGRGHRGKKGEHGKKGKRGKKKRRKKSAPQAD